MPLAGTWILTTKTPCYYQTLEFAVHTKTLCHYLLLPDAWILTIKTQYHCHCQVDHHNQTTSYQKPIVPEIPLRKSPNYGCSRANSDFSEVQTSNSEANYLFSHWFSGYCKSDSQGKLELGDLKFWSWENGHPGWEIGPENHFYNIRRINVRISSLLQNY